MGAEGISDLLLTLLCLAMFAVGFTFGFFEIGKWTGMVSLGISGGLSLGIRLMLFRSGLLFPVGDNGYGPGYVLGWVMITILGVLGGLWIGLTKYQINRLVSETIFLPLNWLNISSFLLVQPLGHSLLPWGLTSS